MLSPDRLPYLLHGAETHFPLQNPDDVVKVPFHILRNREGWTYNPLSIHNEFELVCARRKLVFDKIPGVEQF
jgi:hypothetical protein